MWVSSCLPMSNGRYIQPARHVRKELRRLVARPVVVHVAGSRSLMQGMSIVSPFPKAVLTSRMRISAECATTFRHRRERPSLRNASMGDHARESRKRDRWRTTKPHISRFISSSSMTLLSCNNRSWRMAMISKGFEHKYLENQSIPGSQPAHL
jgi:hypothetical protein